MSSQSKMIALTASAIIIFTAGILGGMRLARNNQATQTSESSRQTNTASTAIGSNHTTSVTSDRRPLDDKKSLPASLAQQEIMRNLRDAMLLPKESRNAALLKALEQTTKLPLTKELLEQLNLIIEDAEIESSHFVISLMEQREEKSSVDFLLNASSHPSADVADRALFALEAVAGNVFKNREEAATWAASWKPDPERVKLFAAAQDPEEENPAIIDSRLPGPRAQAPQKSAEKSE